MNTRMSLRDKGMARLLSRSSRANRFDAVIERVGVRPSNILDLGCGIGALTTRLAEKFPSSLIVGVDRSEYLLRKLHGKRIALTVLADIEDLPLREDFFDVAMAVQVFHEIISLKGTHALIQTLRGIGESLKSGGKLVIFDHVSPGDAPVLVRLSNEMQVKFEEFQAKFKHRKITCHHHGEGLIRISLQDFYDFLTKIWALNSELEEEEMHETHTPFTPEELKDLLQKAGFEIEEAVGFSSVHLIKGTTVQSKVELPDRQIVMVARKRTTRTDIAGDR